MLGFLALNTLLQVHYVRKMHQGLVRSVALAKAGAKLSKLTMDGLFVLYEIERLTEVAEAIGDESFAFSTANISGEQLQTLLEGGEEARRLRAEIARWDTDAGLISFLRQVEQGRKEAALGKKSMQNSLVLLNLLKQTNKTMPKNVRDAEEALAMTKELARISAGSKELATKAFANAKLARDKLAKKKKFFRRRAKMLQEQEEGTPPKGENP